MRRRRLAPRSRPQGRLKAPVIGQIARQGVGGGGAEQLQRSVEIGLSHPIGADQDVQPRYRADDRLQRPEPMRLELADGEVHGGPAMSSRGNPT